MSQVTKEVINICLLFEMHFVIEFVKFIPDDKLSPTTERIILCNIASYLNKVIDTIVPS